MVIDNDAPADNKDAQETRLKEMLNNTTDDDVVHEDRDGSYGTGIYGDGSYGKMYRASQQRSIRRWVEASSSTKSSPCKTIIDKETGRSKHLHANPLWGSPVSNAGVSTLMNKYYSAYTTPEGRRRFRIHDDTDCESETGDACFDSDWGSEDSVYSDGDASLSYSDGDSNFGSSFEPLGFREVYHKKHEYDGVSVEMMDALRGIEDDVTACVRKHFASVTDTARKSFGNILPFIPGSLHVKAHEWGVDAENVRSRLESVTKCFVQDVVADRLEAFRQRIVNDIDAAVQREVLNSFETQQECLKLAAEGAIEEKEEQQRREERCSEHFHAVNPVSADSEAAQPSLKRSFNRMVDDDMEVDEGEEADNEAEPVTNRMKKLKIHDGK